MCTRCIVFCRTCAASAVASWTHLSAACSYRYCSLLLHAEWAKARPWRWASWHWPQLQQTLSSSARGNALNTGVLALYPRIFWMSRFVVAQQIMGGARARWLWRAALTTLLLGIAHLALVRCVHRACTTDRWPRRLAVAGLLLRILLLPLHPVDESPSLALRVCADMLLVAFDGSTGEDATVASSQEHVQHRRPTLRGCTPRRRRHSCIGTAYRH